MANSWESTKPSLSELVGGSTVAPTPVDVPTVSAKPSLSDITSEIDRTNHGFGDFSRTMEDGSTGFSLFPRGFMGGAHGGWANALDFFGADEWAQDHREIRDNEYAYKNGGLTVDDILEDDIGAWETVKRAGLLELKHP